MNTEMPTEMTEPNAAPLAPGTSVEVWCRFSGAWVPRFEVSEVRHDGYLVRRQPDGAVLPSPLHHDAVRPEPVEHHPAF